MENTIIKKQVWVDYIRAFIVFMNLLKIKGDPSKMSTS